MAIWPATLPQTPLQSGYEEGTINTSIRSSMEVGPAKIRRRISAGVKEVKFQFLFTSTQLSTFIEFYEDTLMSGAVHFTWNHPRTGVNEKWRFKKSPNWGKNGSYYLTNLELEILP